MLTYIALILLACSTYFLTRLDQSRERLARLSIDGQEKQDTRIVKVKVSRFASGIVGLLNHSSLAPGAGLWLDGARSVHTVGMLFPIDIVYLDRHGKVLGLLPHVAPGKKELRGPRGTKAVLELAAGAASELGEFAIKPGIQLSLHSLR